MMVCMLSLIPAGADPADDLSSSADQAGEEGAEVYEFVIYDAETAGVALAAISDNYGVGTSNISIFGPLASKLPYGVHYVYWREGQYLYKFAYSAGLQYEDGRFTADDAAVISYSTSTSYSGQATFVLGSETDFSLNPGDYLVWSDLGHYPALYERGEVDYAHLTCVILASYGLFVLFSRLVSSCRRRE